MNNVKLSKFIRSNPKHCDCSVHFELFDWQILGKYSIFWTYVNFRLKLQLKPSIPITTNPDRNSNLPQIRHEYMAVKEKSGAEEMEWSAEEQVQLFLALGGLKPIGINKHFYMVCICERLSTALKRDISPDTVWAHLKKLYNLEALDKVVSLPFPQEQRDFSLPEADFGLLMTKKLMEVEEKKHAEPRNESTRCMT